MIMHPQLPWPLHHRAPRIHGQRADGGEGRIHSNHGGASIASAAALPPAPRIHGQRPDGGAMGFNTVCCSAPRSLHVSPWTSVARRFFHSGSIR
ncbi:hypothetical protein ACQJBY_023956 [Aegilops geniculata]